MAKTFKIKRNDTKPFLAAQILQSNGSVVDLTNATKVYFNLSTNDNQYTPVFSGAAVITGSTTGNVEYRWNVGDTNRSGLFLAEFKTTFTDNSVLTVPADHTFPVNIFEDYDN